MTTYLHYELIRTFRSVRFLVFSLVFPLVLFYLIGGPGRGHELDGIDQPLYIMVGMVAWGTMAAVIAAGTRIAAERAIGWNRQLRLTPLSPSSYLVTKTLTGYAMAAVTIAVLYAAGMSLGVRLGLGGWLTMTGLVLAGLVPFAVLGILLGHLLSVDSIGPATGGLTALLAVLGGSWGPIAAAGWLRSVAEWLPSYWLVQAGKAAVGAGIWPARAWIVIVVWTLVLGWLTVVVYRRDTARY